eukprot:170979-Pleurochrysis_carterae.AAC.2
MPFALRRDVSACACAHSATRDCLPPIGVRWHTLRHAARADMPCAASQSATACSALAASCRAAGEQPGAAERRAPRRRHSGLFVHDS